MQFEPVKIYCEKCEGDGFVEVDELDGYIVECSQCNGDGFTLIEPVTVNIYHESCNGEGCPKCYMMGYIEKKVIIVE